ncbi:MAG TPA: YfhO family protein [Candidatus Angelobacter sp.]|nr:YfhO family protein [Candidatus Angelobacter sp.]
MKLAAVRARIESRRATRVAAGAAIIVAVNLLALVITYRAVVFHGHTMMTTAYMAGSEGYAPDPGYPSSIRAYQNGDAYDIHGPENVFDPAASAWQQDPWNVKASTEVRAGRAPLWNANQGFGVPLLASAQGGFLNPLNWPVLLHPTTTVWDLTLLGRLLLGGILMSVFAWYLGMRVWVAAAAGVAFMLSGQLIGRENNIETSVCVMLPLLLLGIEMCARRRWRSGMVVTGAGLALTILAGMPEESFICVAVAAIYAVVRLGGIAWESRAWRPPALSAAAMVAGVGLGLAVSLPLVLPLLEYLGAAFNIHPAGGHAALLAVDTTTLPQVIAPRWVPLQSNQWFGIAATFLALLGLRSRVLPRGIGIAMLLVALVSTLKEYGWPGWLNDWIGHAPIVEQVYTFRYLGVGGSIAVALLAGAGLHRLVEQRPRVRWWEIAGAFAAIGAILWELGSLQRAAIQLREHHVRIVVATVALLVGMVALALLARWRRPRLGAGLAAAAALVVEMVLLASPIAPMPLRYPTFLPTPTSTRLQTVMPSGTGRVMFPGDTMYVDDQSAFNYDSPLSLDALFPERMHRYLSLFVDKQFIDRMTWEGPTTIQAFDNPFVDAVNVTYFMARNGLLDSHGAPPPGQLVVDSKQPDGVTIYRNTRAMARANVYFDVATAQNEDYAGAMMIQPGYDPRKQAIVEGAQLPSSSEAPIPATVSSYQDDRAEIQVDTPRTGLLVLADSWFPGWQATLDGQPVAIHPANLALRGVVVPAGHHTVVMSYRPTSWRNGLAGAAIGSVAFAVGVFAVPPLLARRRRRGGQAPNPTPQRQTV